MNNLIDVEVFIVSNNLRLDALFCKDFTLKKNIKYLLMMVNNKLKDNYVKSNDIKVYDEYNYVELNINKNLYDNACYNGMTLLIY